MTKTISVEVYKSYARTEFTVGEFHLVEPPIDLRSDRYLFVTWINSMAKQGLVFHSQILGTYLFRAEIPNDRT